MKNEDTSELNRNYNIIFLHHSTGNLIYKGGQGSNLVNRIIKKIFPQKAYVPLWFSEYNNKNGTNYKITEQYFPKSSPYGWNNYPYDYYNIWVKNAGEKPYLQEPTLEMLTKKYDLIIFKHCFPVSNINNDINKPDVNSQDRRVENYKLQYIALKQKLHEFPNTKFLIWTGAAQVIANITMEQAVNAKVFFEWVKNEWDTENDNIFLWDFYNLETEGNLYLLNEYAYSSKDSHPGKLFAKRVAPLFCKRIIEVIKHK